jgi:hypothetical protein
VRIATTLNNFAAARAWLDERIATARPALRAVLEAALKRLLRIQIAFSSTGLDAHKPDDLVAVLSEQRDAELQVELMTVVSELEWRLRELERESMLRAGLLPAAELAVMKALMDRIKGDA